ncbi:hypothetical protein FLAG1_07980 [Fusarium langsethiae]|uniref:F-box domain-containing protein n=1 Tax=Fusarium langsethiae TaxID=179993 RepID=A0A0N0DD48_FUSLA|nr:hypothetical protein FLAG1_07980 [Fusarium langsethiae]GKU06398.1 unnamed protein product [Fusarium langsethiae]
MATNACEEVHPNIVDLISSYTILSSIAPWLSTLDLHNLSLTNRSAYTSIHSSDKIFNFLARQSLCDGRGLAVRQAFKGSYHPNPMPGRWDINPHLSGDEEIEVYLYNVKCIEAEALPCIKCGINVCEECRCYPRAAPPTARPNRRPHLRGNFELDNIMCLCEECDNKTEEEVIDKFVNQRCDCDIYTRWICVRCEDEERKTTKKYFAERTQMEWDWIVRYDVDFGDDCEPSKTLHDHAFERASHDAFGADDDICRKLIGIRNIVTLVRSIRSLTTTQIIRDG